MSSRHDETIEMTRERIELQPSVLPLSQEEFNRRARSFFRLRVLSLMVQKCVDDQTEAGGCRYDS